MIVTRLNPTTNGPLHLGHLFTLMVNEHYAHDNGGKFIVRFDDTSGVTQLIPEEKRERIKKEQEEIINWLGVKVDTWQTQSVYTPEIRTKLFMKCKPIPDDPDPELPLFIRMGTTWLPYPYQAYQTAERVWLDNMIGATHIIRGEDFVTEYALYRYFCDLFKLPAPHFVFLPRLMGKFNDISKTNGGYTIAEMRGKGYSADDLKELMASAVLNWPTYGWHLYNIKPNPRIDI